MYIPYFCVYMCVYMYAKVMALLLLPSTKKAGFCSNILRNTVDASCKIHVQCIYMYMYIFMKIVHKVHLHVHVFVLHVVGYNRHDLWTCLVLNMWSLRNTTYLSSAEFQETESTWGVSDVISNDSHISRLLQPRLTGQSRSYLMDTKLFTASFAVYIHV